MTELEKIFDALPALATPTQVSKVINISRDTIYDWNYRRAQYDIPADMFHKFGRKVMINTAVLKRWFINRCAA